MDKHFEYLGVLRFGVHTEPMYLYALENSNVFMIKVMFTISKSITIFKYILLSNIQTI